MSVINTNITSLIAQQNLSKSQSSLTTAMQRLSSGSRINSAKDDAAGQAIANRMTSQITGLTQASRNANDGISVAQTTEGALNQINDNLQRIRELTVQSQNGTNSPDDLTSIQNEINQRLDEINRISNETSFNGTKVLSKDQNLTIQVGANDGEAINISLKQINAQTLGLQGFNVDGIATDNKKASVADVQAKAGSSIATGTSPIDYVLTTDNKALTAQDVFANLSGTTVQYAGANTQFGVTAASSTYTYDAASDSFSYDATLTAGAGGVAKAVAAIVPSSGTVTATYEVSAGNSIDIKIDSSGTITTADGNALYVTADGNLTQNSAGTTNPATVSELMGAFDAQKTTSGTAGAFAVGAKLTLTSGDSNGMAFTSVAAASGITVTGATIKSADLLAASKASGTSITATLSDTQATTITSAGKVTSDGSTQLYRNGASDTFDAVTTATYTTNLYVGSDGSLTDSPTGNGKTLYVTADGSLTFDAKTAGGRTTDPLAALDSALKNVDALRSDLGAIQNRFDSAITNLTTTTTNLSAARSRIQDADYSVEVANMTKAQILQQAGTSVLAQANQIPQGVLSLLQ